jgi:hypothetical protein
LVHGGVLGVYALAVLLFSAGLVLRERRPALLVWLPLVFPTIHLGAGAGILQELLTGPERLPADEGSSPLRKAA